MQLRPLTSIRLLFALLVVVFHGQDTLEQGGFDSWPFVVRAVVSHGYVGVSFFFVLSGFILSYSYTCAVAEAGFFAYVALIIATSLMSLHLFEAPSRVAIRRWLRCRLGSDQLALSLQSDEKFEGLRSAILAETTAGRGTKHEHKASLRTNQFLLR